MRKITAGRAPETMSTRLREHRGRAIMRDTMLIAAVLTASHASVLAAAPTTTALSMSGAAAGQQGGAREAPAREYQIKAAFLYNFVKYVDWPGAGRSTITIGVLGKNPFGSALETLNGKVANGKTLAIRHLAGLQDARGVDVLFVSASESDHVRQIIDAVLQQPVLTVGEVGGFAQSGGIINFTSEGNRVRFEINPDAAERAGLKISSQLLRLAKVVRS